MTDKFLIGISTASDNASAQTQLMIDTGLTAPPDPPLTIDEMGVIASTAKRGLLAVMDRRASAEKKSKLVWMPEAGKRHTYITTCGRYRVWRHESQHSDSPMYGAELVSKTTPHLVGTGTLLLSGPDQGVLSCQRHADGAVDQEERGLRSTDGRSPVTLSAKERLAPLLTAILRACGQDASVKPDDLRRGPASKRQRDEGCFAWFASVKGNRFYQTIGSQLPMRACCGVTLLAIPEPIVDAFHLYPPHEWPQGVVAPPGAAFGVESLSRVHWYAADGSEISNEQSVSENVR